MNQMLELSENDFKSAIIEMLQQSITNYLKTNVNQQLQIPLKQL